MHVVVMGVTGCGKSSVGHLLGRWLVADFADGDGFHPPANVAKMAEGVPLTDEDRWPWLAEVGAWLGGRDRAVVACSALRREYRDAIRDNAPGAAFVHLDAPLDVISARVAARSSTTDHFAGVSLLDSQFATLEALEDDELGLTVDVSQTAIADAAERARAWIEAREGA